MELASSIFCSLNGDSAKSFQYNEDSKEIFDKLFSISHPHLNLLPNESFNITIYLYTFNSNSIHQYVLGMRIENMLIPAI